jgi:transketolase
MLTVVIEDHFATGGLYSIIAETALRRKKIGRVTAFSFNEKWFKPALLKDVLIYEELTPLAISEKIFKKLDKIL